MPESRRGPFSFDLLSYSGNSEYIITKADFNADNGEILEVIAAGVVLIGDGTADSASSASGKTPTAHGFYVDSLTSPTKITLVSNIAADKQVTIRRLSNRSTASVDFAPGSVIREQDLDNSTNQTLHVAQEAIDIALLSIGEDGLDGKFDGESKVIKNVANGVAATDAVNKGQLDATEVTTLGYRDEAEADKVATAADRVATGADVTSANASADAVAVMYDAFHDKFLGSMSDAVAFTAVFGTDVITSTAHGLVDTQQIQVVGTDLPDGLSASTNYFVRDKDANTFKLAATSGGTAINIVDNGTGTNTWVYGDFTTPATSSWIKNSSTITVASNVGIREGQVVSGAGIEATPKPNVLSIAGTAISISDNMDAVGSSVAVTFANKGIYGAFNVAKDGPALDNDGDALTDGLLYFNTTDDVMKVYDVTSSTWKQLTPTSAEQTAINAVNLDATDIGLVAGKDTEIGRIGTAAMAASIALIGTAPMANSTDGDIKVVADLNTEVGLLSALDTEIGLLGTSAMATATTGNLAKLGAGFDGGTGTSGTTSNLALINTVSGSIDNVNTFVNRYRVAANADLPLPSLDAGDLYYNTNTNELNVYNATTSAWQQATPNQGDIDAINIVAGNLIYQEDLGSIATAVTTSSETNEIGKVAALEDEIERLGTAPMATATTGSIALLGTSAMAHASTGNIKLVADIQANVTKVADIDGNVTKVADIDSNVTTVAGIGTNGADVTTVAGKATEIGLLGTSAMATASTGHLALLGTSAMAHASTGDIKLVADIAANVTKVADIDANVTKVATLGTNGVDVTTVSNIGTDGANVSIVAGLGTNGVDVTTVAGKATEIGRIGTSAMAASIALIGTTAYAHATTGDIKVVADSIGNVNRYANEYVISGTAPTSPTPTAGDLWYDTSTNVIKYHTGSAFAAITTGLSSLANDTAPELGGALDANNYNFTEVGTISGDNLQLDFGTLP
jgi:hypothetical protein